jgi:hypothetical protein
MEKRLLEVEGVQDGKGYCRERELRMEMPYNEKRPATPLWWCCRLNGMESFPNGSAPDRRQVFEPQFGDRNLGIRSPVDDSADQVPHSRPVFFS